MMKVNVCIILLLAFDLCEIVSSLLLWQAVTGHSSLSASSGHLSNYQLTTYSNNGQLI